MHHAISRRRLLQGAAGALALAHPAGVRAAEPHRFGPGVDLMFPPGALRVVGYFGLGVGARAREYRDWYESVHAPDMTAFAAPHMTRYARNHVTKVEEGAAPAYAVLTELVYKSEEAKRQIRALMNTPAADGLYNHPSPFQPAGGRTPGKALLFAMEQQIVQPASAATVMRRLVLLRRPASTAPAAFQAAARTLAETIAKAGSGIGVALDLRQAAEGEAPADALLFLENAAGVRVPTTSKDAQLVNLLEVETRISKVG
jgi:hypothetical protein